MGGGDEADFEGEENCKPDMELDGSTFGTLRTVIFL